MKKVLHLTFFLALIAAIAGGALAFANSITDPIIKENALALEKDNLKVIFPDAQNSDFEEVKVDNSTKTIEKIFKVKEQGVIFKMQVTGYKDGTSFMVAFDDAGKIINYVALSNGDTKGIGTKVAEEPFKTSLVGKNATSDKLDVISGATVSSKPVIEGIQEAAKYMAANMK